MPPIINVLCFQTVEDGFDGITRDAKTGTGFHDPLLRDGWNDIVSSVSIAVKLSQRHQPIVVPIVMLKTVP